MQAPGHWASHNSLLPPTWSLSLPGSALVFFHAKGSTSFSSSAILRPSSQLCISSLLLYISALFCSHWALTPLSSRLWGCGDPYFCSSSSSHPIGLPPSSSGLRPSSLACLHPPTLPFTPRSIPNPHFSVQLTRQGQVCGPGPRQPPPAVPESRLEEPCGTSEVAFREEGEGRVRSPGHFRPPSPPSLGIFLMPWKLDNQRTGNKNYEG